MILKGAQRVKARICWKSEGGDSGDLTEFELGEAQTPPSLGSAYQRTKHQFENRLLAEAVRNDLQPPPLFDKETFKQVRGARGPAMRDRQQ